MHVPPAIQPLEGGRWTAVGASGRAAAAGGVDAAAGKLVVPMGHIDPRAPHVRLTAVASNDLSLLTLAPPHIISTP